MCKLAVVRARAEIVIVIVIGGVRRNIKLHKLLIRK